HQPTVTDGELIIGKVERLATLVFLLPFGVLILSSKEMRKRITQVSKSTFDDALRDIQCPGICLLPDGLEFFLEGVRSRSFVSLALRVLSVLLFPLGQPPVVDKPAGSRGST